MWRKGQCQFPRAETDFVKRIRASGLPGHGMIQPKKHRSPHSNLKVRIKNEGRNKKTNNWKPGRFLTGDPGVSPSHTGQYETAGSPGKVSGFALTDTF